MPYLTRPTYAGDPQRPRYHFLPPGGWMNDPNGLIEVDGRYHLFYQQNPHAAIWDKIHWGHAVSDDLVHWRDLPIALKPDTPGLDEAGIWSGCAVAHAGQVLLFYTGGTGNVSQDVSSGLLNMPVGVAQGAPGLETWHKLAANPAVPALPNDGVIVGQRDPIVWREGAGWRMSIGAGLRGQGGAVLVYDSTDLRHWQYAGLLHHDALGKTWECPQLLTFDGEHAALIVSVWDPPQPSYTIYYGGSYRQGKFEAQFMERLELVGSALYAPQALQDAQGRWLMWGWIRETRSIDASVTAGWSGVMSLPRVVTLGSDGRLRQQPAPEVSALRDGSAPALTDAESQPAEADDWIVLGRQRGQRLEIQAEFGCDQAVGQVELALHTLPDLNQWLTIRYDWRPGTLRIVRQHSSLNTTDGLDLSDLHGGLKLTPGEPLSLRIFVDHSVIEVFANEGRASAATRIYPTQQAGFEIRWHGSSEITLRSANVWNLRALW